MLWGKVVPCEENVRYGEYSCYAHHPMKWVEQEFWASTGCSCSCSYQSRIHLSWGLPHRWNWIAHFPCWEWWCQHWMLPLALPLHSSLGSPWAIRIHWTFYVSIWWKRLVCESEAVVHCCKLGDMKEVPIILRIRIDQQSHCPAFLCCLLFVVRCEWANGRVNDIPSMALRPRKLLP